MKVILQEEVVNLGAAGQIVEVADGYGRNYLFPRKLAVLADERNRGRLAHQQRITAARQAKALAAAQELAAKLGATAISIKRTAASEDKIHGSVTSADIAEALAAQGIELDRKQILVGEPIRSIGVVHVPVKIHRQVEASIKVYVIRA